MDKYHSSFEGKWKRPLGTNFPIIWSQFETTSQTGQSYKIRIQDISPHQYDEVWDMFKKYYFAEEELQNINTTGMRQENMDRHKSIHPCCALILKNIPRIPRGSAMVQVPENETAIEQIYIQHFNGTQPFRESIIWSEKFHDPIPKIVTKSARTIEDEETMNSLKWSTFQYLKQNVSLIAVLDEESPTPTIIGGILLTVNSEDDPPFPMLPGKAREKIQDLEDILFRGINDNFEKLKISHYFDDYGLVVKPEYRRLGVGTELLKTIGIMAKKFMVPAALEIYNNISSQKLAAKLGYTVLNEVKLSDYVDEKGHTILPTVETKVIQLCYRRFL